MEYNYEDVKSALEYAEKYIHHDEEGETAEEIYANKKKMEGILLWYAANLDETKFTKEQDKTLQKKTLEIALNSIDLAYFSLLHKD